MEIFPGKMEINITENGETVKIMEMEQKYGKMEENIPEHLKMTNYMAKERFITLMVKNI